jgi:hypothetical protein
MSLKATSSQLPKKEPAKYALFFEDDLSQISSQDGIWREEIRSALINWWRPNLIHLFIHPGKNTTHISEANFLTDSRDAASTEGILFIHQKINNFKLTYHIVPGYTDPQGTQVLTDRQSLYSSMLLDWMPNLFLINERDGWDLPQADSERNLLISTEVAMNANADVLFTPLYAGRDLLLRIDLTNVKVFHAKWHKRGRGWMTLAHELFHVYQVLNNTLVHFYESFFGSLKGETSDTAEDHLWFFEASANLFSGGGIVRLLGKLLPKKYTQDQYGFDELILEYSSEEMSGIVDSYVDSHYAKEHIIDDKGYSFGYLALAFLHKKLIAIGSSFQELFRSLIETTNLDESLKAIFEKSDSEEVFSFSEFLEVFYAEEGKAFCKEFLKHHSVGLSTETFDVGTVKSTYFGESGLKLDEVLPSTWAGGAEPYYGTRDLQQSLGKIKGWIKKQSAEHKPNCMIYICSIDISLLNKSEAKHFKNLDTIKSVYWINIRPESEPVEELTFASIADNVNYIEVPVSKLEATLNLIPRLTDSKETRSKVGYNNLKITQTVKANLR